MNVFITGASSGIGQALARHYAARGAVLGLFARRADALAQLAAALPGATVATYAGDVRDPSALQAAATHFLAEHGPPDLVIANAGVSRGTLTDRVDDLPAFRAVLETNVLGLVHTFQPFVAALRARRAGTLVGIASVAGFRGMPGSGAYCASKAGAIAYLESLRLELHGSGVHVCTICPGYVETPMTAVNRYRMPFLLSSDDAAARIARAIAARRRFCVIPWPMALAARLLKLVPPTLFDRMFARAPRKPRLPD